MAHATAATTLTCAETPCRSRVCSPKGLIHEYTDRKPDAFAAVMPSWLRVPGKKNTTTPTRMSFSTHTIGSKYHAFGL